MFIFFPFLCVLIFFLCLRVFIFFSVSLCVNFFVSLWVYLFSVSLCVYFSLFVFGFVFLFLFLFFCFFACSSFSVCSFVHLLFSFSLFVEVTSVVRAEPIVDWSQPTPKNKIKTRQVLDLLCYLLSILPNSFKILTKMLTKVPLLEYTYHVYS